jgi:anti-sigma regulatory factor (Ser/Thr protein kinase)
MIEERTFPRSRSSVTQARRFVCDALAGIDGATRSEVAIMVSELAANAVLHAKTAFRVRITDNADGKVRVEVIDTGPGEPRLRMTPPEQPGGRGLRIVAEFADRWGVAHEAAAGKTVWFAVVP